MWPLEDELEVRLMIDLIRHVTGTEHLPPAVQRRCNSHFADACYEVVAVDHSDIAKMSVHSF